MKKYLITFGNSFFPNLTSITLTIAVLGLLTIPVSAADLPAGISPKSLQRRFDAAIVNGEQLSTLIGKEISHLRLYAHTGGKPHPIAYQIDERDAEGKFVYTGGDDAGEDVDQGKLDANDELIFVCGNTGDRMPRTLWPEGSTAGHEIVISDPQDFTKKGWAYLLYFPENPPAPAEEDYVNYDPERDWVVGKYYTVGYEKGYTLFTDLIYPEERGGSGQSFLDRLKMRLDVRLMGGLFHIRRNEGDIRCSVVGWKDGPIRVLRNTESTFRVVFNIPSPSLFSVTEYYPHYFSVPMRFNVPFNMKYVMNAFVISGFSVHMYGDFHSVMLGGSGHTNHNMKGFTFTGKTTDEGIREHYNMTGLTWGFFRKENVGIWCARMYFPDAFLQYFNVYMKDDMSSHNEPEDEPGEIGGGAFVYSESLKKSHGVPGGKYFTSDSWDVIQSGTVELAIDTYMAASIDLHLKPEELREWMAIRDYPLWIDVTEEGKKEERIVGETDPALIKAVLFDVKGRQLNLRDLSFHIGSPQTTAWDHIIGYQIAQEKWYVIPLEEIKRMDFRMEKDDFTTGRPSQLFITVTKKDNSVVELLNGKSASFAGHINEIEKIFIWNPWIERIELRN